MKASHFHAWELRGRYPTIFEDPVVGSKAKELYDDAQILLRKIVDRRLFTAKGVYGIFPANSQGDDIEIYTDDSRTAVLTTFHTLRQQSDKPQGQWSFALADFVAPKESGRADYVGAFAVTTGLGVDLLCREFERDHDDYNSIMAKALADRLVEAFAESLHKRVRDAWRYGKGEEFSTEDLIREKYRGIRPAPGYPACPDHTEKRLLFDLLQVEQNTGITLTARVMTEAGAAVSEKQVRAHCRARLASYKVPGDVRLEAAGEWRMLVAVDHPTPCTTKGHSSVPPLFAYAGTGIAATEKVPFTEAAAERGGYWVHAGHRLMGEFLRG